MYLTQSLHRSVQQAPESVSTICGDRIFTHAQTLERVSRLAGAMRNLGVRGGDRVAILALNSDRYFQLLSAVPWADAVVVPVNIRWSVKEIAYSLNETDTRLIFVDDAFAPLIPQLKEASPQLAAVIHSGDGPMPEGMLSFETLISESDPIPDAHRRGDSLAGIFYTGGTTGFPKGVMLSHRNIFASTLGNAALGAVTSQGRTLHAAPMFHLADLASLVGMSLLGGSHVFIPMFDPVATLAAVDTHGVTDIMLVPTMIQMVIDHPRRPEFDLSRVANIMYGASPMSESLLGRARDAFSSTKFIQAYGMTELSPVATSLVDEFHEDPILRRSLGRAAPHSLVKVVDPDGIEVPRGTVGEIVVSGDHVMLGYWNKPAETAAAIRDGWMHTGDGGYMNDQGFVFIADRIKDMIISGGENVYSIEVENSIVRHSSVAMCAVVAVPDEKWGERVHAVVQLIPGQSLTLAELQDHCKEEIAGYKIPRSLAVISELPMSAAGKILKRELRVQFQNTPA
ncbi:acyl-CoA synthetase [Rhodococcus sp. OK302]|uniref:acyl-CoA synthetase n=1 Tax=Rhodococcus sp. OK302 TaxID=1882769 RepID=UPI000B9405BA|nr:long-chain fatty acid--CoA ligase [Rhodococcus sp. OK302]OYD67031.1 acyl-CoA synthetase (AMP-forming)/AMP-acid ligase II [Rhodococcus sp. OK302]